MTKMAVGIPEAAEMIGVGRSSLYKLFREDRDRHQTKTKTKTFTETALFVERHAAETSHGRWKGGEGFTAFALWISVSALHVGRA